MPGGGHRFEWIGRPPLYWTALLILLFVFDAAWLLEDFVVPHLASQTPSPTHPHGLLVKGSMQYVRPFVGWFYEHGLWFVWLPLILLFLIMFLKRDQVRKVK
jgi:hypothetical protein